MTQHLSHPSAPALHPQYGIVSEEKIVKRQAFNTRNWDTALNKNMFRCVKPEHKSYEKWSCLSDLKRISRINSKYNESVPKQIN